MIVLLAMMVCGIGVGLLATLIAALSDDDTAGDLCAQPTASSCSTVPPTRLLSAPEGGVEPSIKASGVRDLRSPRSASEPAQAESIRSTEPCLRRASA